MTRRPRGAPAGRGPHLQGLSRPARAGVVLVAEGTVSLGVYERGDGGRLRAHARRVALVAAGDWAAAREALAAAVALARARRCEQVAVAVRASVAPARRRQVMAEARRLRCQALAPAPADESRWLFLGAARDHRAADGVAADLDGGGMELARWRGRVLASTARLPLADAVEGGGILAGGAGAALVVSGALAAELAPASAATARPALLPRATVARRARARGAAAALAVRRLMDWTGTETALLARHALMDGLAATLLRAPIPPA